MFDVVKLWDKEKPKTEKGTGGGGRRVLTALHEWFSFK
jgi:hypothetical protein